MYYGKKKTQTQQLQCKPAEFKGNLRGAFLEVYCIEKEGSRDSNNSKDH